MSEIAITFLALTLINMLWLCRTSRQRRLAEARLEISRVVLEMDKLMLGGKIKNGQIAHDHTYHDMYMAQKADSFSITWDFFKRPCEEIRERRKAFRSELDANSELKSLITREVSSEYRAFNNSHPFKGVAFLLYVILFAGGLTIILSCLISAIAARTAWGKLKQLTIEMFRCYQATRLTQAGC